MSVTIIEISPHRNGWKVFESPGVEPVFREKNQAINYPQNRANFRSGEIRILDSSGDLERTIVLEGRLSAFAGNLTHFKNSCHIRRGHVSRPIRSFAPAGLQATSVASFSAIRCALERLTFFLEFND